METVKIDLSRDVDNATNDHNQLRVHERDPFGPAPILVLTFGYSFTSGPYGAADYELTPEEARQLRAALDLWLTGVGSFARSYKPGDDA